MALMQMDCTAAREDIDAHAIGALDAAEAGALETHLARCADCAQLADEARDGVLALALTVPLASGGQALKARVLASAAVLGDVNRRGRPAFWWQAVAAALLLVSLGGLSWGAFLQRRVDTLSARDSAVRADATAQSARLASVRDERDVVLSIASRPDLLRLEMTGTGAAPASSGQYLWSSTEARGALVAENLPPLPEGKSYQLWAVYAENKWVSGGRFPVDAEGNGSVIVRPGGDAPGGKPLWFCVTVEPVPDGARHIDAMVLRSQ
jgi:anti-sigma-K factor RskA